MVVGKTIISIVENYKVRIKDDAIFFAPEIPPKKLSNALDAYAKEAVFEEILVLIDDTLFGSATEGALITDQHFYAHNLWSAPQGYIWKDIEKIVFSQEDGNKIQINDLDFLNITSPNLSAIKLLVKMLNEILTLTNPEKFIETDSQVGDSKTVNNISPMEALRELKKLYDEGILTEEEFKLKKQKYLELL